MRRITSYPRYHPNQLVRVNLEPYEPGLGHELGIIQSVSDHDFFGGWDYSVLIIPETNKPAWTMHIYEKDLEGTIL